MIKRKYPKKMKRSFLKNFFLGNIHIDKGIYYKTFIADQMLYMKLGSWFEYIMCRSAFMRERDLQKVIVSLKKEDVFLDIGANIGLYSLLAARFAGKVYSAEPHFASFNHLCQNIIKNKMESSICALNMGFSKESKVAQFNILFSDYSASGGQVNDIQRFGEKFVPELSYKTYISTIDDLVKDGEIEIPTVIKVDVDGQEDEILQGADQTLNNKQVRYLIVEFDDEKEAIKQIDYLKRKGFTLLKSQLVSKDGTHCKNYHFERK